ncbi:AEC family transporter [Streptococcus vestibularis]|jgi:malate permease|uniref:Auxin efflux carrier n=1 Tax=Streptococcus vestibularis F0396 TaxID=904306 RepID=E3CNJ9_STRVE|nr:AEC family transporter [Streptococcus vestibularis]EFQ60080.1 auxin efflux carrier [Streptococcus vestibularis F0396]MCY7043145.1 AEC family transporter [Streptococcus vestibularis]MDU3179602.1 AEC family transporter [Streptococcus vestibularis]
MSLFLTSITSIIPIIAIIVLGYILQVKGWFGDAFGPNLSRLIMNVALPASIFVSVMKYLTLDKLISLSGGLLYTFVAFILGYMVAYIAVMLFKIRPGRRGTMINTFVNANTIFIGLPLNVALFGDQALPYFLIYYITNTISTWTLGVYLMTSDSKSGQSKKATKFDWKKLLPAPLVGFLVALLVLILRIPIPDFATNTLTYVGNIVTPLSLIYIGIVLAKAGLNTIAFDKDTIVTLVGRFILAPLIMLLVLKFFAPNMAAVEFKTFMIQSATPALAVLPILANQGKGDVEFSTNVVTLSTVLFIVVIPILQTLLG